MGPYDLAVSMSTLDILILFELTLPTTTLVNRLSREHRIDTTVLGMSSLSQTSLIQSLCIGTSHAKHKGFITKCLSKNTQCFQSNIILFELPLPVCYLLYAPPNFRTVILSYITVCVNFLYALFQRTFPFYRIFTYHIKRNTQLQCHPYPPVSTP